MHHYIALEDHLFVEGGVGGAAGAICFVEDVTDGIVPINLGDAAADRSFDAAAITIVDVVDASCLSNNNC